MILLFTDFGLAGPYTGQVKAVLARLAPGIPAIDLFADAPAFDPLLSAYLLAAYAPGNAGVGGVVLGVVDPGVGTARRPVVLLADGQWYVGPDNGLFALAARRAADKAAWTIDWRPETLSASFHGRDLFAPVAARLAAGAAPPGTEIDPAELDRPDWPDDLARIVYVDVYGNAMTGLRAAGLGPGVLLVAGGRTIGRAHTFGSVPPGTPLWYANSNGLAEIAVNGGRADAVLGLVPGAPVGIAEAPTD